MTRHTRRPVTLAARLALWYAGIFILFTGSAFLLFYFSINTILDQRIDEDLQEDIAEMRSLYADGGMAALKTEIRREVAQDNADEIFLRLLDSEEANCLQRTCRTGNHWYPTSRYSGSSRSPGIHGWKLCTWKVMITPRGLSRDCLHPGLILQIGESTEEKEEFMELLLGIFGITFLMVTIFAALVGWFMARKAMRSVEEVTRAAEDVANGTLDRHVAVRAQGEEIERLVNTFNIMVDRIRVLVSRHAGNHRQHRP